MQSSRSLTSGVQCLFYRWAHQRQLDLTAGRRSQVTKWKENWVGEPSVTWAGVRVAYVLFGRLAAARWAVSGLPVGPCWAREKEAVPGARGAISKPVREPACQPWGQSSLKGSESVFASQAIFLDFVCVCVCVCVCVYQHAHACMCCIYISSVTFPLLRHGESVCKFPLFHLFWREQKEKVF